MQQHTKLFKPELETGLLQYNEWNHEIKLKPGAKLRHHKIYRYTVRELKLLRKHLEKEEGRGYIKASTLPVGYPIMFVPKKGVDKDGNPLERLVVNYRKLNDEIVKNR